MSIEPIVVEQLFVEHADQIWLAITQPELMRQWFFEPIVEFRPEVGFVTEFDIENGGRLFRHQWKVTEVVPGASLTYTWRYEGYSGLGSSEWKLAESGGGVRLVLTWTTLEAFPSDIPEFTRESGQQGWEYLIQQSLPNFLNRR